MLQTLRLQGSLTQVELATVTGLSPASISTLGRELSDDGSVSLRRSIRNGRRATLVSLPGRHGVIAAVSIGDRDLRVAMQAPVDSGSGQVGSESVLPRWSGVPIAEALNTRLGAPVRLDNDANMAALGEIRSGALSGVRNGCYIRASHGVGAGLVIDGEVYRGASGTAGEIGHLTLDENGAVCACSNRGCLDTFVGARALVEAVRVSHGDMRFGAVQALSDISLDVRAGEVVALVGDNGAGKSTLVKSIAGVHRPDSGTTEIAGRQVSVKGPAEAQRLGVSTNFQDLTLCDNLDVVGNLFLGREILRSGQIDEIEMERRAWQLLQELSARIPSVRIPVASLSGGQRQTVAGWQS